MKVLVCGGRTYADREHLDTVLNEWHARHHFLLVIDGAAPGADTLAHEWAVRNKINYVRHPADWERYGRAAGPIRNQAMLDFEHPDLVIAFPGGRGTKDMVGRARKAGVRVIEIP